MIRLLPLVLALVAAPVGAQTFIVNQGNFSDGNGSVTVLDGSDAATQLFEGGLGSILQSATQVGGRLYLVANSADRIEVVDVRTRARVGQIGGGEDSPFSSPRYLGALEDGTDRAYVTNQVYFGGNASYVLPLTLEGDGATVGDRIEVDGLPEGMVVFGDSLYVALGTFGPGSGGVDSLAVIDTRQNTLAGYLDLGCYARFVVATGFLIDTLAAFCEDTGEVVFIDRDARSVAQRFAVEGGIGDPSGIGQGVGPARIGNPTRQVSPKAFAHYVITASGIVEVTDEGVAGTISIPDLDTHPVSAVSGSKDSNSALLLLGRPDPDNPFTADGTVTVHDLDGTLLATYPAGIYPVQVTFDRFIFVATEDAATAALGFALAGPNPARSSTALAFTLDAPAEVAVTVHDLLGRTVATVADRAFGAGEARLPLDVAGLAPGPYRVRLATGGRVAVVALTVVR